MREIESYTVVTATGHINIADLVNNHMRAGWQPLGGVAVYVLIMNKETGQSSTNYAQAMVKYKS